MYHNKTASKQYVNNQFNTVDRGKLLLMMFDGALNFLAHAREGLEKNDRAQFARYISKSTAVIAELSNTLDFEKGGDIAKQLARLYDFMLYHLTQANMRKDAKMVEQVVHVLQPVADAFRQIITNGEIDYDKLEAEYAAKKAEQEAKTKQAEEPAERKVAADPSPVSTAGKIRLSF